uniref:MTTase N-terminal domain-containing protein n=1 Tax=Heterorhabditis bacteriophora TaxID=37862 RepID=A0A1I7XMB6_HETBA
MIYWTVGCSLADRNAEFALPDCRKHNWTMCAQPFAASFQDRKNAPSRRRRHHRVVSIEL